MKTPESRAFRRRGEGLWHMCVNCPDFPVDGQFSELFAGINFPIREESSCPECFRLIQGEDCEYLAKDPPPRREKKRPYPYQGHWYRQEPPRR